jgi:hypothetical protein
MSVGLFSLAGASISEAKAKEVTKKAPPKRIYTAVADRAAVPEPR